MASGLMARDYDRNSSHQRFGNFRNLSYIAEALRGLASNSQVTIGDFGCATGLTSMQIFGQALTDFRDYSSSPVIIKHVDLPVNEWGEFFKNASAPECYLHLPETYMEAIGRSQYTRVTPSNHFDLCYCSYSLHWLSFSPNRSSTTYLPFDEVQNRTQAAIDLKHFLQYRLEELKPGGRLIMRSPGNNVFHPGFLYAEEKLIQEGLLAATGLTGLWDCIRFRTIDEWTEALSVFPQYETKVFIHDSFQHPNFAKHSQDSEYEIRGKEMTQNYRVLSQSLLSAFASKTEGGNALVKRYMELYEEFWLQYRGDCIEEDVVVVLEKKIT